MSKYEEIINITNKGVKFLCEETSNGVFLTMAGFGDVICMDVDLADLVDIRDELDTYLKRNKGENNES